MFQTFFLPEITSSEIGADIFVHVALHLSLNCPFSLFHVNQKWDVSTKEIRSGILDFDQVWRRAKGETERDEWLINTNAPIMKLHFVMCYGALIPAVIIHGCTRLKSAAMY